MSADNPTPFSPSRAALPHSVRELLRRGLEGNAPAVRSEVDAAELAVLFPELYIEEAVARGGFGLVWRVQHRRLKRRAALKLLAPTLIQNPVALARFEREMEAAGALDHPGIVRTFDAGERSGVWFLTMEWIDGVDFGVLAGTGTLAPADACELARQAALALHHAHECGLVHRDIKPGNLMLARSGGGAVVKVLDFGIAYLAGETGGIDLTVTGEFLGTMDYAAPEQIDRPAEVGVRTDVFGLGATLYRLLAGVTPRSMPEGDGNSLFAKIQRLARDQVPSLAVRRPDLPRELVAVVDRMVALDPGQRLVSCADVAEALAPFCTDHNFAKLLAGAPSAPQVASAPHLSPVPYTQAISRRRSRRAIFFVLPAIALAITAAVYVSYKRSATPSEKANLARGMIATVPLGIDDPAPAELPILHSNEWEISFAKRIPDGVRSAHYSTDKNAVFFCTSSGAISRLDLTTGAITVVVPHAEAMYLTTSTDGRWLAWSIDRGKGAIGRARANAPWTQLPNLKQTASDQDDDPKGVTFIRHGWQGLPPLQRGDFVVADAGYRGPKGIWRFRCDSDTPPEQIVENPEILEDAADVTCTMRAAFVINRLGERVSSKPVLPEDYTRRILRLDGRRLVSCRTDQPIADPCAITAGPQGELYVLNGHHLRGEPNKRQLLELVSAGQRGHYIVREILSHLTWLSDAGLDICDRGLLISDEGAGMLYELRRR